jgi:hypothetical protein
MTLDTAASAAFVQESRMDLASATTTNRNSAVASILDCSACMDGTVARAVSLLAEDFGEEAADTMKDAGLFIGWFGGRRRHLRLGWGRSGC